MLQLINSEFEHSTPNVFELYSQLVLEHLKEWRTLSAVSISAKVRLQCNKPDPLFPMFGRVSQCRLPQSSGSLTREDGRVHRESCIPQSLRDCRVAESRAYT